MLVILTGYVHTVVHSLAVEIWKRTVRIILLVKTFSTFLIRIKKYIKSLLWASEGKKGNISSFKNEAISCLIILNNVSLSRGKNY